MPEKEKLIREVGSMVTRRTSVMTPLLVLNATLLLISAGLYCFAGAWFLFPVEFVVLGYSLYRYEVYSREQPWMLSSTSVQKLGMQLSSLGDSTHGLINEKDIIDGETIENPDVESKAEIAPEAEVRA